MQIFWVFHTICADEGTIVFSQTRGSVVVGTEAVFRRCSVKIGVHRKAPVPESLFNKVAGLGPELY